MNTTIRGRLVSRLLASLMLLGLAFSGLGASPVRVALAQEEPPDKSTEESNPPTITPATLVLDPETAVVQPASGAGRPSEEPPPVGKGISWQSFFFESCDDISEWALVGTPTWGPEDYRAYEGSYSCWHANTGAGAVKPPADYPNNQNAGMIYGPFDLRGATSARVAFHHWTKTEWEYDTLFYGASSDGVNFWGYRLWGNWTSERGCTDGWCYREFDLADWLGLSEVYFAFAFESDEGVTDAGSFVDSISIDKAPPPVLRKPADGTSAYKLKFQWDKVKGVTEYQIQADNDPAFSSPEIDATSLKAKYQPVIMPPFGDYYWRVRARDAAGNWSDEWSGVWGVQYTILKKPKDNYATSKPALKFSWQKVKGALEYQIQIDDDPGFGSPEIDDTSLKNGYQPVDPFAPGTYYWRVQVRTAGGWEGWTPGWAFTVTP
jgi:hypothetical protein